MDDKTTHWEDVYAKHDPEKVSWYESTPAISLRRVQAAMADGARSLIDVGGGASNLVDHLLASNLSRLAVLDISPAVLQRVKERLGDRADSVEWIVADITEVGGLGAFDIWHDRAVFHFLTDAREQHEYIERCDQTVTRGGVAVLATFAPDGPETCSGLPVRRYGIGDLADRCAPMFDLIDGERHVHMTPNGRRQPFVYASFRHVGDQPVAVHPG
jgi:SAM-dependent methyltransferase